MKKIGLLMLVMVIALGALGIGYASWTDQINVTGTVSTGSVNIDVTGYSGTWVYKVPGDIKNKEIWIHRGNVAMPFDPPAGSFEVAHSVALPDGDDAIKVEFVNIFPDIDFEADATVTSTGSIPVIINVVLTGLTGDFEALEPYITVNYEVIPSIEKANGIGNTIIGPVQLHQGDSVHIVMTLKIPEDSDLMNLSGTFTAKITAIQWNEYEYPGSV
jgi:predicted ribosomally synthesized peptide with SipW-like signal peptide